MPKQYSIPRVLIGSVLLIAGLVLGVRLAMQHLRNDEPIEQVLEPLVYEELAADVEDECIPVPEQPDQAGTQGRKIWAGSTLRAFEHGSKLICVPVGWEPVGAWSEGEGWALYPPSQGGVIVRSDAFESRVDRYDNTPFDVKVVWPKTTPQRRRTANDAIIERAFVKVGPLFPRMPDNLTAPHTVLVTAGVAGNTRRADTRIYPEPGLNLTTLVRFPDQSRAEELFVHAVAHLYNRHRPYWLGGKKPAGLIPLQDLQELEATWTETGFISRHDWRMKRLDYMRNVHAAVQAGDFSLIVAPPFDDRAQFDRIHPDVIVRPGSPNIDYQYGHYILAPLSMIGIQGLLMQLAQEGTIEPTSVEALLAEVHDGSHPGFIEALEALLPPEQVERIRGWLHGGQRIPDELLDAAAEHYRALNEG